MKRFFLLSCCLFSTAAAFAADPPEPAGVAEVRELGRLNGVALACSQADAAARIKKLLIQYAPKTRRYGEAFENATQDAFLAQGVKPEPCLEGAAYAVEAEVLAMRLQAAIPPETK